MQKLAILLLGLSFVLVACGDEPTAAPTDATYKIPPPSKPSGPVKPAGEPDYVRVDHILIGVKGPENPKGRRDPVQAKKYAYALLEDLKNGADWAQLKRQNSEDPPPGGPYKMSNFGVPKGDADAERRGMVRGFGDVGFKLKVGEMGMADWDRRTSPFGYHIIKRVE